MNPLIQLQKAAPVFVVTLVCIGLLPNTQAVSPPPPGGYPNFTTAAGDHALQALTLGLGNTALGTFSSFSVTTGSFNTAVGAGSLDLNTADSNTATGAAALLFNTTGTENTANGTAALEFNDSGSENTAVGAFALFSNTTASFNTAVGRSALANNTTGSPNTAIGAEALASNTTGQFNTATGASALSTNTTGNNNTATGSFTLFNAPTGSDNTATGFTALDFNTTGSGNTATGVSALLNNTTGNENIGLGFQAGENQTTGSNNVYIGAGLVGVAGESNACYIASIFGQTSGGGAPVLINATGKLGTMTSSKRFKEEIKPMDKASAVLLALKPVTFRYKKQFDPVGKSQFGLVAEDVEKVNPDLVVRDKEGKPYSVRYDAVNAMLLNEFLKEHKTVLEQGATIAQQRRAFEAAIAQQQKEIEALTATVKEQAAQIQKVSAQLELSKSAPQTVLNNQ